MTTAYEPGTIPKFDKADRLKKAVDVAGVSRQDLADYLGVRPETVSRYLNGVADAPIGMVRLIAMRTGVPLEWMLTGNSPDAGGPDDGGVETPIRRTADYKTAKTASNLRQLHTTMPSDAAAA